MSWYIIMDENYINAVKQQTKNIEEQIQILDDLFTDYLLQQNLRVSYCDSLKNLTTYYYENFLHKLGYRKTKEK